MNSIRIAAAISFVLAYSACSQCSTTDCGGGRSATKAKRLEAGSYHFTPTPVHHFALADEDTVIQISSVGPFETRPRPPVK